MTKHTAETHHKKFIETCNSLETLLYEEGFHYLAETLDVIRDCNDYSGFDTFLETMRFDVTNWVDAVIVVTLKDVTRKTAWENLEVIRKAQAFKDATKLEASNWSVAKMLRQIAATEELER